MQKACLAEETGTLVPQLQGVNPSTRTRLEADSSQRLQVTESGQRAHSACVTQSQEPSPAWTSDPDNCELKYGCCFKPQNMAICYAAIGN